MTAADVSAVAESVIAVSATGAVAAWVWRTSRRAWKWRRRRQRARVQNDAFPMVATVAGLVAFLAWLSRGGNS